MPVYLIEVESEGDWHPLARIFNTKLADYLLDKIDEVVENEVRMTIYDSEQ